MSAFAVLIRIGPIGVSLGARSDDRGGIVGLVKMKDAVPVLSEVLHVSGVIEVILGLEEDGAE